MYRNPLCTHFYTVLNGSWISTIKMPLRKYHCSDVYNITIIEIENSIIMVLTSQQKRKNKKESP